MPNIVDMKPFNDDIFIRQTQTARHLYHDYAAKMPLIDYHCHLVLKRFFGVEEPVTVESAPRIWEHCNQLLRTAPI